MKTANKPKRNYARWIILIVAVLLCALYFFVPPVQEFVGHAASVLASADVDSVVEYIRSFGAYAMIFSFCLMVFQSVMAPLPAFLITFANAAIFGWWQGAILSWTSSMAGAVLCFYIARGLGRDVVERFAGQRQHRHREEKGGQQDKQPDVEHRRPASGLLQRLLKLLRRQPGGQLPGQRGQCNQQHKQHGRFLMFHGIPLC